MNMLIILLLPHLKLVRHYTFLGHALSHGSSAIYTTELAFQNTPQQPFNTCLCLGLTGGFPLLFMKSGG